MQKEYKVLQGESIYNIAINLYGDVSYAFKIAKDNEISIDADLNGITLTYDDSIKNTVLIPLNISVFKTKNVQQYTNAIFGQSIFDIVLNIDGNLENTLFVAKNSNMTNLNNSLDKTYQFVYNKSIDPVVKWSDSQGLKFKTGIQLEQAKLGEFNEAFDKQAFI